MIGIRITTIHAPSANLVIATITRMLDVRTASAPLIIILRFQPGPRVFHQCTTMPESDMENARNTPTAYR